MLSDIESPSCIPTPTLIPPNRISQKWQRKLGNRAARKLAKQTAIVDSGASDIFLMSGAPMVDVDETAPKVCVGTAAGQPESSSATCRLARPDLPDDVPTSGHVMPGFHHNLLGIGKFCDADCKVLFTKTTVTIFNTDGIPVLSG